jgi:hypothetical protein
MITKEEYDKYLEDHSIGCKKNDYSKMIMFGSEKAKLIKEYEQENVCKHSSIEEIQGGQIERCRNCGKEWP